LHGTVRVPASKSHTIRAVFIASLAEGESDILQPLDSLDTMAAVNACRGFGAEITLGEKWTVRGTAGALRVPDDVIDVANSGTSLYITMSTAALCGGYSVLTGDDQIRKRPAQPLIESLNDLGAEVVSTRANGMPPLVVKGLLRGGTTSIRCPTSQYLTSLLINAPLAESSTKIDVLELNEHPYVEMTLGWLDSQGIAYSRAGFERFEIEGGQSYSAFTREMPADFSSATFFLVAAAITGSDLTLEGLDMTDAQGDKAVVGMLDEMGARVTVTENAVRIEGKPLQGAEFDLNATPDALPAMAVAGCFAEGVTKLANVPQARLKETDRIAVMREELTRMGGRIEELPDGLVVTGGGLTGANVRGHDDHRVVMALAVAGLAAGGTTEIDSAESTRVTFPNFVELMREVGSQIEEV